MFFFLFSASNFPIFFGTAIFAFDGQDDADTLEGEDGRAEEDREVRGTEQEGKHWLGFALSGN